MPATTLRNIARENTPELLFASKKKCTFVACYDNDCYKGHQVIRNDWLQNSLAGRKHCGYLYVILKTNFCEPLVMKQMLFSVLLALFAVLAVAQTDVRPYDYTKGQPQGIVYALPQTVVDVTVTVRRTECRPGPFYKYAERYLALADVVTEHSVRWSVGGICISSHPEADKSRLFEVAPDKKGVSGLVSLDGKGIILGVNVDCLQVESEAQQYDVKTADGEPPVQSLGFDMSVLSEEALTATSMPKMAEFAARQIYRIRESRSAILAGETDHFPDGKALEAILRQYEEDERELIALFAGKKHVTEEQRTFHLTPKTDMKKHVLARISEAEGLVAADDVIGIPVYIDVEGVCPDIPVDAEAKRKKHEPAGFAYIVPGYATVTVRTADRQLAGTRIPMPQFGYVARLSNVISDKSAFSIRFSPRTGAICRIAAAD
ncbi:MAG: DUF4831 family protein [Candidatus Aphodosoma sp.]